MNKRVKLHAELWDKMHFLFRDFNDRMIHVSLEYDFLINIEALKTVIICFFEKVPVLHSSFKSSPINPYWTENDLYNRGHTHSHRRAAGPRKG